MASQYKTFVDEKYEENNKVARPQNQKKMSQLTSKGGQSSSRTQSAKQRSQVPEDQVQAYMQMLQAIKQDQTILAAQAAPESH